MIKTLVFADAHAEPGQDLSRFDALGEFICEERPDYIVDLGDFVSLSSISHWDFDKRLTMEGQRYEADKEAGKEAYDRLFRPLAKLQNTSRQHKTKMYKPKFDKMDGNHEGWVDKYLEQNPSMAGHVDLARDLGLTSRGIVPYPYRERMYRHGINFMHAPLAGNNQPIGGLHFTHKAVQGFIGHVVFGHYHKLEVKPGKRTDAAHPNRAISCPCFFTDQPHYLSPNAPAVMDRGIIIINQDEKTLYPRIREVGMEELL
jgi:hypothetical protein